jgi:hypothetical protein
VPVAVVVMATQVGRVMLAETAVLLEVAVVVVVAARQPVEQGEKALEARLEYGHGNYEKRNRRQKIKVVHYSLANIQ